MILMNLIVLGTAVILCLIMFRYTVVRRQAGEKERIIQNLQMQEYYMQQVEEALSQYREIRHELKNSIFYIDELVRGEDYGRLREYLDETICRQNSITDVVDTGRPIVSALLNQKRAYAKEQGVKLEIQAMLPGNCRISDVHLCTVLANLIDNAVEECRHIPGGAVSLEIKPLKAFLSVRAANPARENVLKNNAPLHSTKADPASHGIGLKVVRSFVETYGGVMDIHMEEGSLFVVECLLGMEEPDKG